MRLEPLGCRSLLQSAQQSRGPGTGGTRGPGDPGTRGPGGQTCQGPPDRARPRKKNGDPVFGPGLSETPFSNHKGVAAFSFFGLFPGWRTLNPKLTLFGLIAKVHRAWLMCLSGLEPTMPNSKP